ncbi:MAG: lysine--tRNA ligase [Patescibacteria group bacterium]
MASLEELREARLQKLELLKKEGINPYPAKTKRDHSIDHVISSFENLEKEQTTITLAGRVMSIRAQGGLVFFNLFDGTAKFQGLLKQEEVDAKIYDLFNAAVDIGDFVEVTGTVFVTKRGEKTLSVKSWAMLSKTMLPLPEKWHGLQDNDEKLRKRYLDILFNPELKDLIEKKAKFWQSMRNFLITEGFLEVETPIIENTTGGADARPFATHHNALDIDVYLRISAGELWQKRLMVAGFPKVFEIGRVFRNEGMSPEHAQDYTQMEFYWGYADYEKGMDLVERMYKYVAQETFGKLQFKIGEFDVDLNKTWERFDYAETIKKFTEIDISQATLQEIEEKLRALEIKFDTNGWNFSRAVDILWKYCRKQISGPGFLVNVPKFLSPLAKSHEGNTNVVQQFQPLIAGSELGKGYSELNDPIDQAERFLEQEKLRLDGDEEAQMNDTDFVEALEHGMPPTCGFGISERLFSYLANKPIRETQIFPLMKPLQEGGAKKKEAKVAVALINKGANLVGWQEKNAIAHLTAAFGARRGKELFKFNSVATSDDQKINLNIQHAILIKDADSSDALYNVSHVAKSQGLEVSEFTREMLETTNDKKVAENTKSKPVKDIEFLGVLVFGYKSEVDELTKQFKLSE